MAYLPLTHERRVWFNFAYKTRSLFISFSIFPAKRPAKSSFHVIDTQIECMPGDLDILWDVDEDEDENDVDVDVDVDASQSA